MLHCGCDMLNEFNEMPQLVGHFIAELQVTSLLIVIHPFFHGSSTFHIGICQCMLEGIVENLPVIHICVNIVLHIFISKAHCGYMD